MQVTDADSSLLKVESGELDEDLGAIDIMRIRYTTITVALVLWLGSSPAWAQNNAKEIMSRSPAELVKLLSSAEASTFDKAKACQRLASVGTKDAAAALVALLPDEKLNVYARTALENIPDPAVSEALRDATKTLRGKALAGVLVSLGQRRDNKAIELLNSYLNDKDTEVAAAAACALGRLGTPDAAERLRTAIASIKTPTLQAPMADAALVCARQLITNGKQGEAAHLLAYYMAAWSPGQRPATTWEVAALGELARLAKNKDIVLLQIRSPERAVFNSGLIAVRELPNPEIAAALIAELSNLPAERQALLLRAMGDRPDHMPLPVVITATKSPSVEVREAAIYVLTKQGGVEAVPVLLDIALAGGDLAQNAKAALAMLAGDGVDVIITSRLAGADAKTKAVLFDVIGARRITAAEPYVRQALSDPDKDVRAAAITALGQLVSFENLELLTSRVLASNSPEEAAVLQASLQIAAMRMSDVEGCAKKLVACLGNASTAKQDYFLRLLGKLGGQTALEAIVTNAQSQDPATKDAATKVLGEWSTAEAAPVLLDIAKNDAEEKYRVRALRGYIRIARQLQLTPDERQSMYTTAMSVAQRNDERQIALEILLRVPNAKTLELAVAEMDNPALKQLAGETAVRIAHRMAGSDPKAIAAAMQKVVDAKITGNLANIAKQLLEQSEAGAK